MEEKENLPFETAGNVPPVRTTPPVQVLFPTGRREIWLCLLTAILAVAMADFVIYGGFQLGFGITAAGCILCAAGYLLACGKRLDGYSGALLVLSLVIAGSFARSDDGFVKFVMFLFLLVSASLGLCLLAGQNRRSAAGAASLLDVPRTIFALGFGRMGAAFRGLKLAGKEKTAAGRKRTAVLTGLVVAVPILAILIPLLISADAAFEGLLSLLPKISLEEPVAAVMLGLPLACVLYTAAVALNHNLKAQPAVSRGRKVNTLTVNTVLGAVCAVYAVYLLSQLAYFSGGFSGILPEEFTMAEYARRGFFEMAWLCALDLAIMTAAVALTKPVQGKTPGLTRVLCLVIGLMTLFFVATASAKMFLYIGGYGLTRLRVLTEVIMVFLGITTALVCVWLFVPKFAYMKAVVLTGLILGAAVAWVDVDTVVAKYNVEAYRSGQLRQVDIGYLGSLSDGAVPYIAELAEDPNPTVAETARRVLEEVWDTARIRDFRSWNIAGAMARDAWDVKTR